MKVLSKCPTSLKKKRSNSLSIAESMFKDQRSIANIRERQRTQNLNSAFENLKKIIPTLSTDKLSKIQTLKIAKAYIQFLNQQLIEEPTEKCQFQDELKRKFSIWRMENEQVTFDSQTPGSHVSIDQVTSSSDFLIKEEYEKDSFDKDSLDRRSSADEERPDELAFDKHLCKRNSDYGKDSEYENGSQDRSSFDEFHKNGPFDKSVPFDRESFLTSAFGSEAFEHKFTFVKNIYSKDAELINVIVDY